MKIICLFGELRGFSRDSVAESTEELLKMTGGEQVVVVSHGLPTANSGEKVDPLLLRQDLHLHAFLLAQTGSSVSPMELEYLQQKLAQKCTRTFGMVRGWNSIPVDQRTKILDFLQSSETVPSDPNVQSLLGFDSPVLRLALRVALEIALRELSGETSHQPAMTPENLLSPAITLARREPSLSSTVIGITRALESDHKRLPHEISLALTELQS